MTIIIFGGTGMLGHYMTAVLSKYYSVECINRDKFDILNDGWDKLEALLKNLTATDVVVNCAGVIPQKVMNECRTYFRINSVFPHKIQQIADKIGFHFIHITTDCVFDGMLRNGSYSETDNKLKNMEKGLYGVSKAMGEPERACMIRTSIIGEEITHKKSLLEWVKYNAGGEINGFENHYWNGITCLTLSKIILTIINKNMYWRGVRHIYSPEIVSKYELCKIINDIYQLNIKIKKIYTPLMMNKSLTSIYNTSDNFTIPSIKEQIAIQKKFCF